MDRLDSATPAAPVDLEAETAGWDAHAVWQTRVHDPRQASRSAPPRPGTPEARDGWDPLQTWRMRVQRARTGR